MDINLIHQYSRLNMPLFRALCSFLDSFSRDADALLSEAAFPNMLGAAVGISQNFSVPPADALLLVLATKSLKSILLEGPESTIQLDASVIKTLQLTARLMRRANLPQMMVADPIASLDWLISVWVDLVKNYTTALQQSLDPRVARFLELRALLQFQAANYANEKTFQRDQRMNGSDVTATLLPRETEVLAYLSKGFTIKEIASLMGIPWFTVNDHIKSINKKQNINSRADAAVLASKMGLL